MRQYFCYMSPWGAMKLHPSGEWAMGHHPSGFALGMIWTHCPFTLGMQFHCTPRAHVAKIYCHMVYYTRIHEAIFDA